MAAPQVPSEGVEEDEFSLGVGGYGNPFEDAHSRIDDSGVPQVVNREEESGGQYDQAGDRVGLVAEETTPAVANETSKQVKGSRNKPGASKKGAGGGRKSAPKNAGAKRKASASKKAASSKRRNTDKSEGANTGGKFVEVVSILDGDGGARYKMPKVDRSAEFLVCGHSYDKKCWPLIEFKNVENGVAEKGRPRSIKVKNFWEEEEDKEVFARNWIRYCREEGLSDLTLMGKRDPESAAEWTKHQEPKQKGSDAKRNSPEAGEATPELGKKRGELLVESASKRRPTSQQSTPVARGGGGSDSEEESPQTKRAPDVRRRDEVENVLRLFAGC